VASIVIAARHLELPESEAARAATATVGAYCERMANYSAMRALDIWYDRITVEQVLAEELLAKPPTDRCCAAPLALMKPFFDGEA
jgi:hypothetical protein